jgi:hypothetical protein
MAATTGGGRAMTDTWQSAVSTPIPPPPTSPPPGWPPLAAPAAPPAVNSFLGAGPGKQPPSRAKLGALIGIAAVAATGAWFAFGQQGSATPAGQISHAKVVVTAAPPAPVATTPQQPQLASAPTSGLDFGGSPKLAAVLPKIELFVEESRGHRYKHAVAVTPLSDKAFLAQLHKANGPATGDDSDATAKALHLLPAGLDTAKVEAAASDADVAGFYDFATKHLYVRSTTLNPLTQSILAHELTHALDDQYFNLAHVEKLGRNSDQEEAIVSLVEGDARSVEDHFSAALTPHRQQQEKAELTAQYGSAADHTPFVLELFSQFPYVLGSEFVNELHDNGGAAAIDAAFRKPPTSTLQILDPLAFFVHRVDAITVAAPAVPTTAGTKLIDRDTLGPLVLAAVLAEAKPTSWGQQAAVEEWAGDSYVTTRTAGRTCVRDSIRTPDGTSRIILGTALTAWARTHSGSSVTVTGTTSLLLVSCTG